STHPNRSRQMAAQTEPGSAGDCAICLDKIQDKKTLKCRHSFCSACIDSVFKFKPACPICNTYHGVYTGTQPSGTMTVTRSSQRLSGFERCGSIVIQYSFPSGIQGPEHPNPGVRYSSTSRTAYLPACEEGEKVLRLLRKAFDRRLLFTVGRSATTGLNNVITWNDIHHKTSIAGGPQSFGYPDPEYLFRVQEELRLKGVTEDD
uniref:E3 ubiquitin-protein ligase n=1 Tax=Mastacembelus armatus TaxID=205130 RepID=A0A7N8XTQ8_9TELE